MAENQPEKKQTNYKPEEQRLYSLIMTALERTDANLTEKEKEDYNHLASDVAHYIVLQFNSESKLAWMEWPHFREVLGNAIHGLVVLIYIKNYTTKLEDRDPLFLSARNLISMLATCALNGKGYMQGIEEIRSKQPINVKN